MHANKALDLYKQSLGLKKQKEQERIQQLAEDRLKQIYEVLEDRAKRRLSQTVIPLPVRTQEDEDVLALIRKGLLSEGYLLDGEDKSFIAKKIENYVRLVIDLPEVPHEDA